MSKRVLVLEDDESLRLVISRALTRAGFDVRATASPDTAVERMARRDADLLIADVLLGQDNFLDRLEEVGRVRPDAPVLVISAQTTAGTAIKAVSGGAYDYLPKPFDLDDLVAAAERALKTAPAAAVPARDRSDTFGGLVGRSPAMQDTFQTLGRLSRSGVPVVFTGPEGSGRASAARTLHRARRKDAPLTEAGPAALDRSAEALFEQAKGGGLLLRRAERWSEQVQDQVLERLETPAAHAPLIYVTAAPQARDRLLAPLWERLAVGHVRMPPVRERDADGVAIFEHHFNKHSQTAVKITDEAQRFILDYPWPGEAAEIERAAVRLAVQGRRDEVQAEDLREILSADTGLDAERALYDAAARYAALKLADQAPDVADSAVKAVDRALIETALALAGGVRRDAAARLGLNRNTLSRRMAALGLGGEDED